MACNDSLETKFFHTGYIRWDDEDNKNQNRKMGTVPDGYYDLNTKIYFCCRHDDSSYRLQGLPKCAQMILMRYKGACFTNANYSLPRTGFLQWDTENNNNIDRRVGAYPDGQRTFHIGIKIEFCTYTSNGRCYLPTQKSFPTIYS